MAISVRDIQEKEFSTEVKGGYKVEEVDDFLDEIAEQLSALIRENLELNRKVTELEADLAQAKAEAQKAPEYNEKSYFDNLQSALRESLIGAQRIADETVANAKTEAERITADAQAQADVTVGSAKTEAEKITADARCKLSELESQYETMKASAKSFKADFSRILEEQAAMLREKTGLL